MKKIFCFLMAFLLTASALFAQQNNRGGFRHGNSAEMREKIKLRIKDELQLTDAQADSVATITQQYQAKIKAVKEDNSIPENEKEMQVGVVHSARKKELKAILTDEQIAKLQTIMQDIRKMKEQIEEKQD